MKKTIYILFIFSLLFFPSRVDAVTGNYTYDVNTVTLVKSGGQDVLQIKGWAYICAPGTTHVIQPKYKLYVKANTDKGVVSKEYNDSSNKPSYSAKGANPNDYSRPYYTRHYTDLDHNGSLETSLVYPDYSSSFASNSVDPRVSAIKNSSIRDNGKYTNYFAINLNFEFNIPIDNIFELASQNDKRQVYMNLDVELTGGSKTVYGATFTEVPYKVQIPIAIQEKSIDKALIDKLANYDYKGTKYEMTFNETLTDVVTVVEMGQVINAPVFNSSSYYFYVNGSVRSGKRSDFSGSVNSLYFYNHHGSGHKSGTDYFNKSKYHVTQIKFENDGLPASHNPVYFYGTTFAVNTSDYCYGERCVYYVKDGPHTGWIPSFWVTPLEDSLTLISYKGGCNELPESEQQCCKTPSAPACKCKGKVGKDYDCCMTPSLPICADPCKDQTDPKKHYCCKYPNDVEYCNHDYKTNKPNTCSSSSTTEAAFVYPTNAWTQTMLQNNACKIGCYETLKVTFQPQQSVRAGMGFKYPVNIKSSRYCTADYDNPGWKTKVDNAATAANTAYNNMVAALNSAASKDSACGSKTTLTSVPSCSCGSRSGMSCHGCTCSRTVFSHYTTYSCGSTTAPSTCYRAVYKTEYYTCTKSASCPSGYSYRSSLDRCARDVCSRSGQLWSSAQSAIASDISRASSYRSQYNSYTNTVNNLKGERTTCDNFIANNRYQGASKTKISTSNIPNQSSYEIIFTSQTEDGSFEGPRKYTATTYPIYQCNNRSYSAPSLIGESRSSASSFTSTYCNHQTANQTYRDFWNKKSDSAIVLEFATQYYIQKYTGDLSNAAKSGYDYHGRYSYTDYYSPSRGNNFSLNVNTLGPNMPPTSNTLWSINPFTCQYNVTNMIFPPTGDSQNVKYGSMAFSYRQISLTDPFPGRNPNENWNGKVNLITTNGYKIYSNTPLYKIILDPATMQSIRGYGTNYGSFYINDPSRSQMVEVYTQSGIIQKRK